MSRGDSYPPAGLLRSPIADLTAPFLSRPKAIFGELSSLLCSPDALLVGMKWLGAAQYDASLRQPMQIFGF